MSKEIDFEFGRNIGATHYSLGDDDYHFAWVRFFAGLKEIYVPAEGSHAKWFISIDWDRELIAIADKWTIHNNDKPLCELSDEQAAQLFNAWRNGGELLVLVGITWAAASSLIPDCIHRIRPKSERDEFVDKCLVAAGEFVADCDVTFAKAIFDAIQRGDIKAPEVSK